ncbi:MAG TPA: GNAT family N-acetyltransferase [Abditibacterium sp.]|jgi:RimJ/RimL family protein N-acetyltransferase
MNQPRIEMNRLELVAGTPEMVRAEMQDPEKFSRLLDAALPTSWPPQFHDLETMAYSLEKLELGADQLGWWCWYSVRSEGTGVNRLVVGIGGFKGRPDETGSVELGYSVVEDHQNLGFATEAVRGLVNWATSQPEVKEIIAETLPDLGASIRVLEKNGFVFVGAGSEEGVIRYRLMRD